MTPEERKEKKREYNKKWRAEHPDYFIKKNREWKENNKEHWAEYCKKWREDNREHLREYDRSHKQEHYEKRQERLKNNKESYKKVLATNRKYALSQKGRARKLLLNYKRNDKDQNRSEPTITAEWIVNEIFTKSCFYCGDSDWEHLGCDRINDSEPHTPENCICSCGICNIERNNRNLTVLQFKEYRSNNPIVYSEPKESVLNENGFLKKKAIRSF